MIFTELVSFLKSKAITKTMLTVNEEHIASLYAEFAEEDRELSNSGLEDYILNFEKENTA